MRSHVETPQASKSSQLVPAAAIETVERPLSGHVGELPRQEFLLRTQIIGLP
jgi:hypothetical protein